MFYHHINYAFYANKIEILKKSIGFSSVKTFIKKRIDKIDNKGYINAFLLGDKSQIDTTLFNTNGISHLLAISGMHMTMIINFLTLFLKKFQNKTKLIVIQIIIWFYIYILGFTISALKAVLYYTLLQLNQRLNLKFTKIQILIICLITCLFLNPFFIYDIAFLYSFILFFSILSIKIKASNSLVKILKLSCLAFLVSLPITAIHFYQINLLAILYSILFSNFVMFLLFPLSLITFCFSFFLPCYNFLADIFFYLNDFLANISWGQIIIPKVSIFWWILYYLVLIGYYKIHCQKFIYILILLIIFIKALPKWDNNAYVYFLDVNQGDCSLIISPNQKDIVLIDTGGLINSNKNNYLIENLNQFFKSKGLTKISYLILSHGDYDHMGASLSLVSNLKIQNVIFNNGEYNDLELKLIRILQNKNINYYQNINELKLNSFQLKFLTTRLYDNENDNSNVLYFKYLNYQFLYMGDASANKENDILKKYNLENITFLKVGHHGSKTSTSPIFINKIQPKYAIISVGKNNNYNHPNPQVLNILANTKIYRTDDDGSIEIKLNKKYFIKTSS